MVSPKTRTAPEQPTASILNKQVSAMLPRHTYVAFRNRAIRCGLPMGTILRELIEWYIAEAEPVETPEG